MSIYNPDRRIATDGRIVGALVVLVLVLLLGPNRSCTADGFVPSGTVPQQRGPGSGHNCVALWSDVFLAPELEAQYGKGAYYEISTEHCTAWYLARSFNVWRRAFREFDPGRGQQLKEVEIVPWQLINGDQRITLPKPEESKSAPVVDPMAEDKDNKNIP